MIFINLSGKIPLVSNLTSRFEIFYQGIHHLMGYKNLLWATLIGIIAWLCECYGFYIVLKGFQIPFSFFNAIFVYALSTIAGAITMLPGGIGATEGSMTALLVLLFNISKSLSVASTIITRVCTLWFAVLVGVLTLFLSQKRFEVAGILDGEVEIVDGR